MPTPQGADRYLPLAADLVVVVGVIAVVLWQMHLPLLLSDTTTTGGDTGAHFMMPSVLKGLLSHGHLTGWDPSWYDGYPIYTFYFVLPDLLTAVASYLIPYDVAFKLVTVLGSVTLPLAAWGMGKLFRLRPPVPAALAAFTLPFLFENSFTIYGGNLFSTMAGEYAFSLSLSLSLVFLGLFARGLRTGRHRGLAAVTLALCIAAHIIPAGFALCGAALLTLFELLPGRLRPHDGGGGSRWGSPGRPVEPLLEPSRALWWGASTAGLGVLLSGWWLVPFAADQAYSTSMGYQNVTTYMGLFFPGGDTWALLLAAVAVVVALVRRSRFGLFTAIMGGGFALALVVDPLSSLYNVRLLPLWFLCVYLMAGWLVGVTLASAARAWRRWRASGWARAAATSGTGWVPGRPRVPGWRPAAVAGPLVALLLVVVVVVPPFVLPAADLPVTLGANQVTNWAAYNYSGYEAKPGYPEYQGIMATMDKVGRTHGCGRAMWEYNANQDRFGTPEALMLLPYFTGGCIDSEEGLLFESSTTTPFHFLDQAELSVGPSEPMSGIPYGGLDVALGVEHLQMLGVRYYLASSPQTQAEALADPSLTLVAHTGPYVENYSGSELTTTWDVFLVHDAPMVAALSNQPAVVTGVSPRQSSWLPMATAWYADPTRWDVPLAAGGPASWERVTADQQPKAVPVPHTTVSDVHSGTDTISFHVSRTGTPVVVRTSYFPNWHASGAQGPWRITPNLMVVVPTSHQVTLSYGSSPADLVGLAASVAGVATLAGLWLWRRRHA